MRSQRPRRKISAPRRKPRGEGYQRRGEILAAARGLFLKEGVERVTIRSICARVGISAPALYRHFKDKRELMIAVCNETMQRLLDAFRQFRREEADPLAMLKRMMEHYVRFALDHPDEYRLVFMSKDFFLAEITNQFETDQDVIDAGIIGPLVLHELTEVVAICMERGILRPGDPQIATEAIWSCGHGLASLFITHPHFWDRPRDALIAAAMEMTMTGLLKR
jgi:AcrR family transcriptional regulator